MPQGTDTSRDATDMLQRQLDEAFGSFKETLREMLTAEARRSVDGTIQRLSREAAAFSVEDIEVEVVIRDLKVRTGGAGTARQSPSPARRRRRSTGTARRSPASDGAKARPG